MAAKLKNHRLYPPFYHSRYTLLSRFRKSLQSLIKNYPITSLNDGILVDLGCGNMPYRPLFLDIVHKYVSVDLKTNRVADIHFDKYGKSPLPDKYANIVLSTQVLEHVPNPHLYLKECRRILKPYGKLILTTHGHWPYHPDPHDYRRWTCEGLRKEVIDAGFRILHFEGIIGLGAIGIQFLQDPILKPLPSFLRHLKYLLTFLFQVAILISDLLSNQSSKDENAWVFMIMAIKEI